MTARSWHGGGAISKRLSEIMESPEPKETWVNYARIGSKPGRNAALAHYQGDLR